MTQMAKKQQPRRYGPAPTLDLGVDGAEDRPTYQRRHGQAAKLQQRLDSGEAASIRVSSEADADALSRFFGDRYAVRVQKQGTGWRVTIIGAGEALVV